MAELYDRSVPWQDKGRWYKLFIESDGVDYVPGACDIEIEISSTYAKLPEGFHVLDSKYDVHFVDTGSAANTSFVLRNYADGRQGITLPAKANFDYMTIYVYGYNE